MNDGRAFEACYDDETEAALDAWRPGRGAEPPATRGRVGRGGITGLAVGAIALGLREVLEGDDERERIVEFRPDDADAGAQWVSFVHVPGAPRRSRLIVRPWLAPAASRS